MAECSHKWEQEGLIRERDRKGVEKVIRSYRCQACGAICTDKTKPVSVAGQPEPVKAPQPPTTQAAPPVKEETMAEKKNGEKPTGRRDRSLADGWETGKTYKKVVKRRKDGKQFTCTMLVMKGGFKDQDGKMWDSPTALTTHFMNKRVGVSGRRPAKAFFAEAPKAKSIETRPDCKGNGSTKKKPAKKAPAKAASKPAAKPTTAPKKTESKAPAAKAEASASTAKPVIEELPEL